jgi:transposase-like protein
MTKSTKPRQRLSPTQRAELLEAYEHSGLSQRAFAGQAGISLSSLQLWLRAVRTGRAAAPAFVELPNPLPAAAVPAYRLRWADGLVLELGCGFAAEELAVLLQVVEGRCSR